MPASGLPVSIDTAKALVARHAIHAGAEIINDITALQGDPAMLPLAVETGCGVCAMHMRGTPQTMQDEPAYADVVADVTSYLRGRRDVLLAAGVTQDRIALDPGIGFGKTTQHNLQLLANAWRFHELGCPVLVGHSRKRFLADAGGADSLGWTAAPFRPRMSAPPSPVPVPFFCPIARPAPSAWRFRWPDRGCRYCASTTWRPSGRHYCCFKPPAGWNETELSAVSFQLFGDKSR